LVNGSEKSQKINSLGGYITGCKGGKLGDRFEPSRYPLAPTNSYPEIHKCTGGKSTKIERKNEEAKQAPQTQEKTTYRDEVHGANQIRRSLLAKNKKSGPLTKKAKRGVGSPEFVSNRGLIPPSSRRNKN